MFGFQKKRKTFLKSAVSFVLLLSVSSALAAEKAKKTEGKKSRNPNSAQGVKCQVSDQTQGVQGVDFTLSDGEMANQLLGSASLKGHKIKVVWNQATPYEAQATFAMTIDGYTSTLYDFTTTGRVGPINVIEVNNIRFQCWVE